MLTRGSRREGRCVALSSGDSWERGRNQRACKGRANLQGEDVGFPSNGRLQEVVAVLSEGRSDPGATKNKRTRFQITRLRRSTVKRAEEQQRDQQARGRRSPQDQPASLLSRLDGASHGPTDSRKLHEHDTRAQADCQGLGGWPGC